MKTFNPLTGEVLTNKSSLQALSEAKKTINIRKRELIKVEEEIDNLLKPFIVEGDKKLANFWDICKGRNYFNKELFENESTSAEKANYNHARNTIREIEERYSKQGDPFLKFPKF